MVLQPSPIAVSLVALMVLSAGVVSGQSYPNKPVRIVTVGPGEMPESTNNQ